MDKAINSLTFVLCPYHVSSSFVIFFCSKTAGRLEGDYCCDEREF